MTYLPYIQSQHRTRQAALLGRQLTLGYGEKTLLHTSRLELRPEQLTALAGPNGAGKSTLLRSLSGLQAPLEGEVSLEGQSIEKLKPADIAQKVSLVLTQKGSLGMLTVRELVSLGRAPYTAWHGQLRKRDRKIVDEALGQVGMSAFAQRQAGSLSDGERQKVMIARALAQDTPIILLDEPTAHLDLSNRLSIFSLLQRLTKDLQKSILISTHELALAVQMADELWLIEPQEKALHQSMPEELLLAGVISRAFPQVNFDWSNSGFIKVPQPCPVHPAMHVYGDSLGSAWTAQALARNGFPVCYKGGEAVYSIEVVRISQGIQWIFQGHAFHKLSDLLHFLLTERL